MPRARKGRHKLDTYQIGVTIIEARHLEPNHNPMVVVRVGNRKKKTAVRKNTDNPYYNEYFVFDLTCNMEVLLNTKIEMAVYLCGRLKRSKFYGNIVFEVATVWDQPDHQYHHKWAMLTNPRELAAGPRGYLKCNIAVHAKGEKFKMPPETEGDDDIEGNLLLPLGDPRYFAARQRARYVFTVHRAEELPERGRGSCRVFVSFAGMKASTRSRGAGDGDGNPRFNERIVFKEMFPPLCHRARILLRGRGKEPLASYLLNLRAISNSGEYGFLPTFGPSFLHLYAEPDDFTGPIYRGRLLLSLKTEIETVGASGVDVERAPSIVEGNLWRLDEYLLVGIIQDVSMIDRSLLSCGKTASIEISLGNAGNRAYSSRRRRDCIEDSSDEDDEDDSEDEEVKEEVRPVTGCANQGSESETVATIVACANCKYNFLELGEDKPCVFLKSRWPNTEWRIRNANRLSFIADNLARELERLEALVSLGRPTAYHDYNALAGWLRKQCSSYLHGLKDVAGACDVEDGDQVFCMTSLDRHRLNLCKRELKSVLGRLEANGELPDNRYLRIAMIHAYGHLRTIRNLSEDPQHSLPDVFVWLVSGNRRLAYARLPSSRLCHADEPAARGRDCGRRLNLFLERANADKPTVGCKLEVFLWLGNAKFAAACWEALPPGFELEHRPVRLDHFPRHLRYQFSKFQLRAHIFQGRFEPGMDSSGLLDPMLRVIFQGYIMTTRVIKQTLDPFWDQTLVFPPIDIHGMREHVKKQPPKVVLEALDQDYFNSLELYGRCIADPLVKLNTDTYSPPDFPPKLSWYKFSAGMAVDFSGAVLAALELIEIADKATATAEDEDEDDGSGTFRVPDNIRPRMAGYRLEVIFWGVRDMKRVGLNRVTRPKVVVELAGARLESPVMENSRRFANFQEIRHTIDLEMPEEEAYYPALTIKAYDSRGFGYFKYIGVCGVPSAGVFLQQLVTKPEYETAIYHSSKKFRPSAHHAMEYDRTAKDAEKAEAKAVEASLTSYKKLAGRPSFSLSSLLKRLLSWRRKPAAVVLPGKRKRRPRAHNRDDTHDFWSKYYMSLLEEENNQACGLAPTSHQPWKSRVATLKVYAAELEAQPEFSSFQDRLRTFELSRGKTVGDSKDDEKNYAGKFKGFIAVYRWPHPDGLVCVNRSGRSVSLGLCNDYPSQEPQEILVRLYVVKAIGLRPCDPLSGKADPYLLVKLGKHTINEKKKYIPNQLNPTFGRLFEMEISFPKDHTLTIQVWDYDATSSDDLIGETRVDIESRFYSRHRAHCGLGYCYEAGGYNAWRDREKPCLILRQLCRRYNLPLPEYWRDYVKIGKLKFPCHEDPEDDVDREERMALSVLHRWADFPICGCALVPEHIERRPLFNPKRPGLEQGVLEMWIDMFCIDELPLRPAVDITPQPPEDYELRVTIWNTEDVPLVDSQFLTGEKCSDIYVKGWILPEDTQRTDVHYNSLTGEGNFNWRFIYRFTWARGERMMIISRKSSAFARHETEHKMPCRLNLQVWDSDHFSKDDFLGALSLDLGNMPKGSHSSRNCSLRMLEPQFPKINLFQVGKTRAWWPLAANANGTKLIPAGKVEMELAMLSAVEAEKQPVGKAREPPESLPSPDRPDTSFSWFRNPWKACCFVVCRYYRWRLIGCCCCLLLVLLVACGIYAFPGYFVKRLLGA